MAVWSLFQSASVSNTGSTQSPEFASCLCPCCRGRRTLAETWHNKRSRSVEDIIYGLMSLPRKTLNMIEQLICERLENNTFRLRSANVELPRRKGCQPSPFMLEQEQMVVGWEASGGVGPHWGAERCCCEGTSCSEWWRPSIVSVGTHLGRFLLMDWSWCDGFRWGCWSTVGWAAQWRWRGQSGPESTSLGGDSKSKSSWAVPDTPMAPSPGLKAAVGGRKVATTEQRCQEGQGKAGREGKGKGMERERDAKGGGGRENHCNNIIGRCRNPPWHHAFYAVLRDGQQWQAFWRRICKWPWCTA